MKIAFEFEVVKEKEALIAKAFGYQAKVTEPSISTDAEGKKVVKDVTIDNPVTLAKHIQTFLENKFVAIVDNQAQRDLAEQLREQSKIGRDSLIKK